MEEKSRRSFLKKMAIAGTATIVTSQIDISAIEPMTSEGLTILFQGDSITDGNRGRNEDPNHIMGHGYAFSIASRLGAEYPQKRLKFYNRGVSGNKIIDLAARWQTDTLDLKPDVLSILIGVNDTSSVVLNWEPIVTIEQYEEVYDSLLKQTKAKLPDIVLVLCEPFILPVGTVNEHWTAYHAEITKRQEVVSKLSKKYGAIHIAFQEVFDKACKKAPADYWIWDGVHPTVAGHELLAKEWIKRVI
ncbi:MAG TPA: SGNH/GDSL hydrolase family protein [Bacteroidales bacterium]|nr:SGNH/GDSL hydrolase family protein [Bacteroidales bacterium]